MHAPPTAASSYLLDLARRIAQPYAELPQMRAILLTGSCTEGLSDYYSDIDMSVYYETLPTEEQLAAARQHNGGSERSWLIGTRDEGQFAEAYQLAGIEIQIGHTTVAAWEADIASIHERLQVDSPLQKALDGTAYGIALAGAPLIAQWQARIAAYPDALAEAMVRHYLAFFPIWYLQERFDIRDAALWHYAIFVESAQHILGVLAGLNRRYYSTFQFKRMRRFIDGLTHCPPALAERIEQLFVLERRAANAQLEALVRETVELVEQHMPQIDTSQVRRRIGQRQAPWGP